MIKKIFLLSVIAISILSLSNFSPDVFGDEYLSPKKQIANGVLPEDVTCRDGLDKIFRSNGDPICVKSENSEKITERIIPTLDEMIPMRGGEFDLDDERDDEFDDERDDEFDDERDDEFDDDRDEMNDDDRDEMNDDDRDEMNDDDRDEMNDTSEDVSNSGTIHTISILFPGSCEDPICYEPSSILVIEGDLVVWINESGSEQIITSGNPDDGFSGEFQSSVMQPGDEFEYLFDNEGTFDYYSIAEPWLMGTIEVSQPPPLGNENESAEDESNENEEISDDSVGETNDDQMDDTSNNASDESETNASSVEITSIPSQYNSFSPYFSKYVNVFGVNIFASTSVSDSKLQHTANVMAHYLDNDKDGIPDNKKVVDTMVAQNSWMWMFADEDEGEKSNLSEDGELFDNSCIQDLYARETNPSGGFDASLEEVLHLITHCGYANAYPDVFGEESGTEIANIMDKARGGHFENIPSSYPSDAWYTYGDQTCEYNCMITEYFYWSLTSILGAQTDRFDDIGHEWKLNTESKVKSTDKEIYDLLTDPEYKIATVLPDGDY